MTRFFYTFLKRRLIPSERRCIKRGLKNLSPARGHVARNVIKILINTIWVRALRLLSRICAKSPRNWETFFSKQVYLCMCFSVTYNRGKYSTFFCQSFFLCHLSLPRYISAFEVWEKSIFFTTQLYLES